LVALILGTAGFLRVSSSEVTISDAGRPWRTWYRRDSITRSQVLPLLGCPTIRRSVRPALVSSRRASAARRAATRQRVGNTAVGASTDHFFTPSLICSMTITRTSMGRRCALSDPFAAFNAQGRHLRDGAVSDGTRRGPSSATAGIVACGIIDPPIRCGNATRPP
jgi:hypothetical protein